MIHKVHFLIFWWENCLWEQGPKCVISNCFVFVPIFLIWFILWNIYYKSCTIFSSPERRFIIKQEYSCVAIICPINELSRNSSIIDEFRMFIFSFKFFPRDVFLNNFQFLTQVNGDLKLWTQLNLSIGHIIVKIVCFA